MGIMEPSRSSSPVSRCLLLAGQSFFKEAQIKQETEAFSSGLLTPFPSIRHDSYRHEFAFYVYVRTRGTKNLVHRLHFIR